MIGHRIIIRDIYLNNGILIKIDSFEEFMMVSSLR
jgi:hypothetical protein